MELNHLSVFFRVAKAGRFTDAAKQLNISQSALSRSVALLEESQGVKLFERSKQGVALTPVGLEVFHHCRDIFETVQKIEESCRGVKEKCEGPLRFAATDHVLTQLLMQPLRSLREDFPEITPVILTGTPDKLIESVSKGDSEFALQFWKTSAPQIASEPLREDSMALVVHADIWRKNKRQSQKATIDDVLKKVGYISAIGAATQTRASQVMIELFGKVPRIGFETNDQEAQKQICLAKGGIAYLSRFMVEQEIENGLLHEINISRPHAFKLWLSFRKGHVMSLTARTFLDRLREKWRN